MKITSISELKSVINKEQTLLITTEEIKREILHSSIQIGYQKVISKSEFYNSLFTDVINTKILIETELLTKLNLQYNSDLVNRIFNLLAFSYLQNIDNIYSEFVEQHQLIEIPMLYKTHKIYSFGIENEYNNLLENIDVIETDYTEQKLNIQMFNNELEEIGYVANEIRKLIDKGVSTDNIVVKSSYETDKINLIFNTFGLFYNLENKYNLIRTKEFKNVVTDLKNGKYNSIQQIYAEYSNNKQLVDVLNKFVGYDNFTNLLISELESKSERSLITTNNISKLNTQPLINENKYIFICGFADNIVEIKTERNSLSREQQKVLNLSSDDVLTNTNNKFFKSLIYNHNVTITANKYIDKLYPIELAINNNEFISESHSFNSLMFKKEREIKRKYNIETSNYLKLKNINVEEVSKATFNSKLAIDNLKLSATSINEYINCPFRFYVNRILKIRNNKQTSNLIIGNFIHSFLEIFLRSDQLEVSEVITELLQDESYESLIIFEHQLNKYLNQLTEIIDYQDTYSKFNIADLEYKVQYNLKTNVLFEGVVDKILAYNDKRVVIDYKSGNSNLSVTDIENQTDLQNAIYINILQKLDDDAQYIATFKQHVKPKISSLSINNESILNNYKLNGFYVDSKDLYDLCTDFENNNFINGLSLLKDGSFRKNKNLVNRDKFNQLIESVDEIIDNLIKDVFSNKFTIRERRVKRENGCKFCQYNDLCFKNYLNIEEVSEDKDEVHS